MRGGLLAAKTSARLCALLKILSYRICGILYTVSPSTTTRNSELSVVTRKSIRCGKRCLRDYPSLHNALMIHNWMRSAVDSITAAAYRKLTKVTVTDWGIHKKSIALKFLFFKNV